MYGGGTKPESYCKITLYLQHNAPLIHDNIQDLCLFGIFNVRGDNGVTFLLPDKKTQAKIDKLVGQDAKKAVAMINACVLPVYLPNIEDFGTHKDDIPNKLGNKLPVKEVTSSSVELVNGAKITRDSKFKRMYETSKMAVYSLDGEVPTVGESSNAMNKKKSTRKGGYYGGNDDFKVGEREKSGTEPRQMIEEAIAISALRAETGGIDYMTHLGMSLLHWMQNQDGDLKKLATVLCKVHPISPLYYLFILPLLSPDEISEWVKHPTDYNRWETLCGLVGLGAMKHSEIERKHKTQDVVTGFTATSICETIIGRAGKMMDDIEILEDDCSRWGGCEGFKNWICLVSEFTFLYTKPYVGALHGNDKHTVEVILNTYKQFVLTHGTNWRGALTLICPELDNMMASKERFCTILSCYISRRFFPMGGNLDELAKIDNGNTGGVIYGKDLAPNLIVPTSDEHLTAKFWKKTVPN